MCQFQIGLLYVIIDGRDEKLVVLPNKWNTPLLLNV
jgi:hypothetical protein